jgi:alpha-amylase/alpha-mannosidase (GH57 family)
MHQPDYRVAETGVARMPWVRLHAARSYGDMADVFGRFDVRHTVNFSGVLLSQLEELERGGARDAWFELLRKRPEDYDGGERAWAVRNLFSVNHGRSVKPVPRYAQLLEKRGENPHEELFSGIARGFRASELRDLQVLFLLAWCGFASEKRFPAIRALRKKGRGFSEDDKAALFEVHEACARGVLESYRGLARSEGIEITVSPFDHPILPLVAGKPVGAPEDAVTALNRAGEIAARVFGARPRGVWPSEGSVSPEAVQAIADAGFAFAASDEGVLLKSIDAPRSAIYQPYVFRGVRLVFRDHEISDAVGFRYAQMSAHDAVRDFMRRVEAAPGEGVVFVILDGENPWEAYEDNGRLFLEALSRELEGGGHAAAGVRAEFVGKAAMAADATTLRRLHAGSWIDASFRIWIGHDEKNRAWDAVVLARRALVAAGVVSGAAGTAWEHLYRAEGSDWFWWFGDDFQTPYAEDFDALFRGHLRAAYRAAGLAVPEAIERSIRAHVVRAAVRAPERMISPDIARDVDGYYDWRGAGIALAGTATGESGGTMALSTRPFEFLEFGFDATRLCVRLRPAAKDWRRFGLRARISVLGRALEIRLPDDAGRGGVEARFSRVAKWAVRCDEAGWRVGERGGFSVEVFVGDTVVSRFPASGEIEVVRPSADSEREDWSA